MKKLISGFFILALLVISNIFVSPEPASASKMVTYTNLYTYDMMTKQLKQLEAVYPDAIHLESIDKTPYQRNIWSQNDNVGIWLASEAYKMWYPVASKNQKVDAIDNMLLLEEEETFYQYPNILKPNKNSKKPLTTILHHQLIQ
ncbi:hypothetical protein [Paenibacillus arenosi]|uniref:Uncharacterized protein n=1 Tax=Paenibacillus arenosi TaxID=2774142 RepID=A0ABR9AXM4_9BACL|nr:hypothetical protein [Paenibacillus arenosi]MBD8498762.1 hypothetical protein [Paenibacillus arenosi]